MQGICQRLGRWISPLVVITIAISGCDGPHRERQRSDAAALGEKLFLDARLSADGRTNCGTCHDPTRAFTDGNRTSTGAYGRTGTRNATSLLDVRHIEAFFWDGRERDLTEVVLQPLTNAVEHGNADLPAVVETLRSIPEYRTGFMRAFGRPPDRENIGQALVEYVLSIDPGTTRLERYLASGEEALLTHDERAGLGLFKGKAGCAGCHVVDNDALLTDRNFHHAGVGFDRIAGGIAPLLQRIDAAERAGLPLGRLALEDPDIAELGRFAATREPAHLGAFRTPSLRNVANTGPYMHDGSVPTLEAAIDRELYYRGIALGRPISLTVEERQQLLAFLHALSIEQPDRRD